MKVVKRNGKNEDVRFDKLHQRVKSLSRDLPKIDAAQLAQKAITGLHDGITTTNIDNFLAETAAMLSGEHPQYAQLAARVAISRLHKETNGSFYQTTKTLWKNGVISERYLAKVREFSDDIEKLIDYSRDLDFDYFGFKTLEKSYLLRIGGRIVERPQHLFMRVAVEIGQDFESIRELYECLSLGKYTHATPTLFHAGTKNAQLSSCFLIAASDDSIEGIFDTVKECAQISKHAGGIGLHIHNIRAKGSHINGTNGTSDGIVPFLKIFNETARAVNQAGRRKGSFAIYLEPWHADIEEFLELKRIEGSAEMRTRDLFLALWIPDLFMKRVENDEHWTLMCPNVQKGLSDVYGADFERLYEKYESQFPDLKRVKARHLMTKIIESQLESGVPYILFKDACNEKSNQKNIGTIKSSNLCTEILEVSNNSETAVCNLASICLPKFVHAGKFDFDALHETTKIAAKNLDNVIDLTFYPIEKARKSNLNHRPMGIGVQGLADVFFLLNLPYASFEALELDRKIFATMYHAAMTASHEMAKAKGPYSSFAGSPLSEGKFQFDLWNIAGHEDFDWDDLRQKIMKDGARNSLMIALMPTASTSQIYGNMECFEAMTSNYFSRQTLAGTFQIVNRHLVAALENLDLWTPEIRDRIIRNGGSVQSIESIPDHLKEVFQTVWEISQKHVIDHAAIRAPYVCQSQSMNLFFADPNFGTINSALFYAWKKGLKTGCYYTRTKPAIDAVKVTVPTIANPAAIACSLENPESCVMCQ